jgi:hypothetical protein
MRRPDYPAAQETVASALEIDRHRCKPARPRASWLRTYPYGPRPGKSRRNTQLQKRARPAYCGMEKQASIFVYSSGQSCPPFDPGMIRPGSRHAVSGFRGTKQPLTAAGMYSRLMFKSRDPAGQPLVEFAHSLLGVYPPPAGGERAAVAIAL